MGWRDNVNFHSSLSEKRAKDAWQAADRLTPRIEPSRAERERCLLECIVQLQNSDFLAGATIATVPATMLWGVVSARMQARPWRMMALAVAVTATATVFQLAVNAQTVTVPAMREVLEHLKLFQLTWISVALGMGGALMGAAVAAQAAQLHATEIRRIEAATTAALDHVVRSRKAIAALKGSDRAPDHQQEQLASERRHQMFRVQELQRVVEQRRRLGMDPLCHPDWPLFDS